MATTLLSALGSSRDVTSNKKEDTEEEEEEELLVKKGGKLDFEEIGFEVDEMPVASAVEKEKGEEKDKE